jgi:cyclopropane-fatty-acyl-phospholipid synthase
MSTFLTQAMENGHLPDSLIRFGIRKLCRERLKEITVADLERRLETRREYIHALRNSPLAVATREANEQHYEVPASFFDLVLGQHKKYSSAHFSSKTLTLDQAEAEALETTMKRAGLKNGQKILELGCGWGSLTLAMARKFPDSSIIALSNSNSQREWIESRAKSENLRNVRILTRNIVEVTDLQEEFGEFDRVVSVEMFEHLRNYELLFSRISKWLKPSGELFVHIFTHRDASYFFETDGEDNWMGRYFFTGGQMPAQDLFLDFQRDLLLVDQWAWSGTHYGETSERWLQNLDHNRDAVLTIFRQTYGEKNAIIWLNRWRIFFMACAELFNFDQGREWGVTHYRFINRKSVSGGAA